MSDYMLNDDLIEDVVEGFSNDDALQHYPNVDDVFSDTTCNDGLINSVNRDTGDDESTAASEIESDFNVDSSLYSPARVMDFANNTASNSNTNLPQQQQQTAETEEDGGGTDCIDKPLNENSNEQCDCLHASDPASATGRDISDAASTSRTHTSLPPLYNQYRHLAPAYTVNLSNQSHESRRKYSPKSHHPQHRLSSIFSPSARLYGLDSMMEADDRLKSFDRVHDKTWFFHNDILALVRAGFYSNGFEDSVRCFSCNLVLFHWQIGEDPIQQHAIHTRYCPYMRVLVGQRYINSVKKHYDE
jgi:hypothetical protein